MNVSFCVGSEIPGSAVRLCFCACVENTRLLMWSINVTVELRFGLYFLRLCECVLVTRKGKSF